MTKEEYKTLLAELSEKENLIKRQIEQTKVDYITEFAVAKPDDKVKLTVTDWYGKQDMFIAYVRNTYVSGGEICHSYNKSKTDGSRSIHKLYIHGNVTHIEVLEPAKP